MSEGNSARPTGNDARPVGKAKKIFNIILNVLVYAFFAICIVGLVMSVTAKKDPDGAIQFFGTQMRIVVSPSMEKCDQTDVSGYKIKSIPVKSIIFIECVPEDESEAQKWYSQLKKGDVLTFKYVYAKQETITHRIVEISPDENGGYVIKLEGDNKNSDEATLSQIIYTNEEDSLNYVIGRVTGKSLALGLLVTAVKSPVGLICIVIVPCTIIIVLEILRIVSVLNEGKRKKQDALQAQKDYELEALKKRLEELEGRSSDKTMPSETEQTSSAPFEDSADNPSQKSSAPPDEGMGSNGQTPQEVPFITQESDIPQTAKPEEAPGNSDLDDIPKP